jgi:iron complex outermembrane receptor protein
LSTSFSYIPQYVAGNPQAQYQFGNTFLTTVRPSFYSNTVKWEETTTYNAGLDFELFRKVKGTLDVYQKESKDLLAFVAYPDGANLTNFGPRNFGNLEVKGIELGLNFDVLKTADLNWNINFNANYQDRKITATALDGTESPGFFTGGIRGGVGNTIQINSTGFAPNAFFVYEQVYGTDGRPLEGVYVDRNGDGLITPKDMYQHKQPYADFTFGLMSSFSYKKWDMSMSWRASLGNYIYDNNGSSYGYLDNSINQITPLNNINPSFFETGFVNEGNNRYFSDHYIQDASFIKLDNISFGYSIAEPFGNATTARLSFGVQNALIISKYKGLDPEILSGIDQTIYPRARMFVFGCNVNF